MDAHPRARLARLDARLDALPGGARSLAPGRARATPLTVLVDDLAQGDEARGLALSVALAQVVGAELEHFPENLFWDSDALAASLARETDEEGLASRARTLESLMRLYGVRGPMRFQYVHDFVYGFDWALWVSRHPTDRAAVPPFGMPFLRHSERRGRELHALIARGDDPRYRPLPEGSRRNVFRFSREPADEERLMRTLALEDGIPVQAWSLTAAGEYRRDFHALRVSVARRLGIVSGSPNVQP